MGGFHFELPYSQKRRKTDLEQREMAHIKTAFQHKQKSLIFCKFPFLTGLKRYQPFEIHQLYTSKKKFRDFGQNKQNKIFKVKYI